MTVHSIEHCSRCGGAHHELDFEPLTQPHNELTHWAACPVNGQPILLRILGSTPRLTLLAWAVSRWRAEVSQRPLANIHRRTLDDTWRQVLRYAGGNDRVLLGSPHDELVLADPAAARLSGTDAKIAHLEKAVALLNSMVLSGETHSETSLQMVRTALD